MKQRDILMVRFVHIVSFLLHEMPHSLQETSLRGLGGDVVDCVGEVGMALIRHNGAG